MYHKLLDLLRHSKKILVKLLSRRKHLHRVPRSRPQEVRRKRLHTGVLHDPSCTSNTAAASVEQYVSSTHLNEVVNVGSWQIAAVHVKLKLSSNTVQTQFKLGSLTTA